MTTIDLGDPLPNLSVNIYDTAGALANAGSVTLTITLPDGTTTGPTVTSPSTGVYVASYVPTQTGRHVARWVATGANASAYTAVYNVVEAPETIVGLDEAKAFLNKASTADDEQIRFFLEVVSDVCERFTRKVWRRQTFTETHSTCDSDYLYLRNTPVISVTSVVVNGTAVTDYVVDKRAGLLRRGTTLLEMDWEDAWQGTVVTYVAGPADGVVPANIRQGCLLLLRHMWDTQRGGSGGPRQNGAVDEYDPALGFYIPNRVRQAWGEPRVLVR